MTSLLPTSPPLPSTTGSVETEAVDWPSLRDRLARVVDDAPTPAAFCEGLARTFAIAGVGRRDPDLARLWRIFRLAESAQACLASQHEIRNLLQLVVASVEAAIHVLPAVRSAGGDEAHVELAECLTDANAAAGLLIPLARATSQLGPRATSTVEGARIGACIERAARLAGKPVAIQIDVDANIADAALAVVEGELMQVLINVFRNAQEALAGSRAASPQITATVRPAPPLWLRVDIDDNGPGLPPSIAERLGEPFVSTKSDGTGLGLFLCHSLVAEWGGRFTTPATAEGARFSFTVPLRDARASTPWRKPS